MLSKEDLKRYKLMIRELEKYITTIDENGEDVWAKNIDTYDKIINLKLRLISHDVHQEDYELAINLCMRYVI